MKTVITITKRELEGLIAIIDSVECLEGWKSAGGYKQDIEACKNIVKKCQADIREVKKC